MAQLLMMVVATLVLMINVDGAPIPAQNLDYFHTTENCNLPKHAGRVKKFEFPTTLPMRKRRAAHLLDAEYVAKYEKAYELLRALPDSDGRSLKNQAHLHCLYCDDGLLYPNVTYPLEIHNGWFFLPWHRLFLYFHERILAKLIGDDTFALPFWNWDNQTPTPPYANVVPPMYSKNTSSLFDANRSPCAVSPNIVDFNLLIPGICSPRTPAKQRAENNGVMYTQLVTGAVTPELFFGSPYHLGDAGGLSPGTLETNPHGKVHFFVGNPSDPNFGDMGNFANSSRDPTFYAHHANIDRLWKVWKKLPGGIRKDPESPDFLNSEFVFYDEEGDRVAAKVSQTLDTSLLRYNYQKVPNPWISAGVEPGQESKIPLCFPASKSKIQELIKGTPVLDSTMVLNAQPITFRVTRPPPRKHGEEILEVDGINMNFNQFAQFNAYLFFPTAIISSPTACPEFFGTFNYVPHAGQAKFTPKRVWRAALGTKLKLLKRKVFSEIIVTLVPIVPGTVVTFSGAKIGYIGDTEF